MAGGRSVSYEVYYLQYGRWQIHHRYSDRERDEAIEESKRLDSQGHFDASCVMRESYEAATGISSESIIYHSPKLKNKPQIDAITGGSSSSAKPVGKAGGKAGGGGMGGGGMGGGGMGGGGRGNANSLMAAAKSQGAADQGKGSGKSRQGYTFTEAVPKLLIGFLLACFAGTVLSVITYYGIRTMAASGYNLGQQLNQVIVIAAWLAGWGAVFIPVLHSVLASIRVGTANATAKKDDATLHKTAWRQPKVDASKALDEATSRLREKEKAAAIVELPPDPADPDEDLPEPPPEEPEPEEVDTADEDEDEEEEPQVSGPEQLRKALGELVAEAIRISDNSLDNDHFMRFGVILFLAGAAETLARRFKVVAKEVTAILKDQIEALGVPGSTALGFAANIDEYLLDKRYFEMYSAGRGGVLGKVDEPGGDSGLPDAFTLWRSPKSGSDKVHGSAQPGGGAEDEPASSGFVAVLFTDIVNSTRKQQEMGDEWLMNVVRAHNDIVREAISKHSGREIKHTGDGIMASFPAVNSSVEAALLMQEGVNKFSEMMPNLAFEICVGISAGEPIHESGDLFGTPVNLAARVLSKASARQIAVSSIVREMCRGKNFSFNLLGEFDLKGFDGPQPIFLAIDQRRR